MTLGILSTVVKPEFFDDGGVIVALVAIMVVLFVTMCLMWHFRPRRTR